MTTEAELVAQLRALGIPDWGTARWLMDEAAKRIESQAAEIERLKAELGDLPEAQAMLLRDCKVKDALLRQALEALEKTRAFHQQNWSSEEITPKLTRDTIAAIKQHLGEV